MLSSLFSKARDKAKALKKSLRTSVRKITGGSDYQRWSNEKQLSPNWNARTERIATLIEPGASVIEFGAGRMVLKRLLPENCAYTPSDLVDRGNGTIVCDLNSYALPPFPPHDVAVLSGVLDYVNNVPRLVSHLSNYAGVVIASYAVTEFHKKNRRRHGWVNDFSSADILQIFESAGFSCDYSEVWRRQIIYRFTKRLHAS
jgi:hypothetical protein